MPRVRKVTAVMIMNFLKTIFRKIIWFCHYLSWLFRYVRLKMRMNVLRDIKIISVEFCSVCNLRCRYCFIEKKERPKFLDFQIYEKLVKEVASNPKYNIKTMEWPISGEFLLYPDFRKVIEVTRRLMDEFPHFRPHIILNENLVLFDEEKIDFILKSKTVRQIICSIDGHDAASFERLRPSAKFPVVFKNMQALLKRNEELGYPVIIQINNGRDADSLGHPLSEEMKSLFGRADDIRFWQPKEWNESFHQTEKEFSPAKGFCTFVFNNVSLSASGFISKCCMDLKGATDYADLRSRRLEEIWHSQTRRQFLKLMFQNQRQQLEGCKTCSITNTNNDNQYGNIFRTVRRGYFQFIGRRRLVENAVHS